MRRMDKKDGALDILKTLRAKGYEALWAGGCVRDQLLGREAQDYDIATNARPEEVMKLFSKTIPVGIQFGVVLVLLNDFQYEVATFRAEGKYVDGRHPESVRFCSAKEDALRRDFTINGMFYDPEKKG